MKNSTKAAQINFALGVFVLFFGLVTIVGMFFSTSEIGSRTSLVAGLVLSLIGAGMCLKARIDQQKNIDE